MRVRTDDEIYRIDAVWLGPPRATFPWRATYASYLLGFLIFITVLFVQRRMGIPFSVFPTAWALVITVFLTRVVSRKVNYEKGVVHLIQHFWYELNGPREHAARRRTSMRSNHVRLRTDGRAFGSAHTAGLRPLRPSERRGPTARPGAPARQDRTNDRKPARAPARPSRRPVPRPVDRPRAEGER